MAEGLETRQEVTGANPSGAANQPARQLGMVSVQAPRGGDMSKVGAEQRALAEVLKLGGQAFDKYLEQKHQEDTILGEMDYMQGRTEAELSKEGISVHRLRGYKALQAKTAYNEWFVKSKHDLENGEYQMSTDEYKQVLAGQAKELFDSIDPNDVQLRDLAAGLMKEGFSNLVSQHVAHNAQYMQGEYENNVTKLLVSESMTGNIGSLQEIIGNINELTPTMSDEARRTSIKQAIEQTLMDGNFTLYDEFGGADGMRTLGFETGELKSIEASVQQAEQLAEEEQASQISSDVQNLLLDVKLNSVSREEAFDRLNNIKDMYRLSDSTSRGLSKKIGDDFFKQSEGKLNDAIKKQEELIKLDTAAGQLRTSGFSNIDSYSTKEQQRAMQQQRQIIAGEVVNDPRFQSEEEQLSEIIRRHVQFLRDVPLIDNQVKQAFQVVGQSSPIGEGGLLDETHMEAFQYVEAMKEAGISERVIKDYAGDAYEYLSLATSFSEGSIDPKTAMMSTWDLVNTPKDQRPTPKAKPEQVYKHYEKVKDKFFDNMDVSVVSGWLGGPSSAKYDEVLSYEVKEVAKNSKTLDTWVEKRIRDITDANPQYNTDTVMGIIKRDMSSWEYVMGNLVPPKGGSTVTEAMGLENEPGAMASHSAMLMFMQDHADTLFPKGTEQREWWESVAGYYGGNILDGVKKYVTGEGALEKAGKQSPFNRDGRFTGFSEERQRLLNNIRSIDLQRIGNNQAIVTMYTGPDKRKPVGVPMAVDLKSVGDYYKLTTNKEAFDKAR